MPRPEQGTTPDEVAARAEVARKEREEKLKAYYSLGLLGDFEKAVAYVNKEEPDARARYEERSEAKIRLKANGVLLDELVKRKQRHGESRERYRAYVSRIRDNVETLGSVTSFLSRGEMIIRRPDRVIDDIDFLADFGVDPSIMREVVGDWINAYRSRGARAETEPVTKVAGGEGSGPPRPPDDREIEKKETLEYEIEGRISQLIRLAREEIEKRRDSRGSLRYETIIDGITRRFYSFQYVDIFKAKVGEPKWADEEIEMVKRAVELEINGRCNLRITEIVETEDFATALKNNWTGSLEKYVTEMKGGQLTPLGEEVWGFFGQLENSEREGDGELFEVTQKKLQLITQLGMFGLMWGDLSIRQKAMLADDEDKDSWWRNKYVNGKLDSEKKWEGEDLSEDFYSLLRSWGCDELVGEVKKGGVLRDFFIRGKMPIAGINKAEFERASEILLGGKSKGDSGTLAMQVFWGTKMMGQFFAGYHLGQLVNFNRSANFLADKFESWSGSKRGNVAEYGVSERNGMGFYEVDDAGNIDLKKKYSRHKVGLMSFDDFSWKPVDEGVKKTKEEELKETEDELRRPRVSEGRKIELSKKRDTLRNFLKATEKGRHDVLKIKKGPLDSATELKYGTTLPLADAFLKDDDWRALSVGPMNQLLEVKRLEVGTDEEIKMENVKVDKAVVVGHNMPKDLYDSKRKVNPWYLIWAMNGTFLRNVNLRSMQATRIGSTIEQNALTAVSTGFELRKKLKELGKFGTDLEVKAGPENAYALLLGILTGGRSQVNNGVLSTKQLEVYFRKEMDNVLYGIDPRNRQAVDYSLSMKALRFWTPEQFNTFAQAIVSEPEVVDLVREAELITYIEKIKGLRRQSLDAMREISTGSKDDFQAIVAAEDAERKVLPFELGERVVSFPKSMQARSLEFGWKWGRILTGRK